MKRNPKTTTSSPVEKSDRHLEDIFGDLLRLLDPPEDISVSASAEKYIYINNPGQHVGNYSLERTPYMQEPMDTLKDRRYPYMAFVGPAQCSKTEALMLGFAAYTIVVDPSDLIIYSPTQGMARDFSMRRIDRMHENSPEIGRHLVKTRDTDNVYDKHYKSGIILDLSHPSKATLAGRPIPRVCLTDFDRMDDDIDGDGNAFDLACSRSQTFGTFRKNVAESSPSRDILDPRWLKKTPHEGPPCTGIVGLYNRGDRRMLYWPCPRCGDYFSGEWKHIQYPAEGTKNERARGVWMQCPLCEGRIEPSERHDMLQMSVWLKDGQSINSDTGKIIGKGEQTNFASFWLNGVAAGFSSWEELVQVYLNARGEFERTKNENPLKRFFNTNLGVPYLPERPEDELLPEMLKARAVRLPYLEPEGADLEDGRRNIARAVEMDAKLVQPCVPTEVRGLIATVDVQNRAFIVQVMGPAPGTPYDLFVIDRFKIVKSDRLDANGERHALQPASYLEDWDLIRMHVMSRTYPVQGDPNRRMHIKMTFCDSGGEAGVTGMAYNYQRKLVKEGQSGRFHLLKGMHGPSVMRTQIAYPDSKQSGWTAAARGDVPVLFVGSNIIKDELRGRLDAINPGTGRVVFPDWLADFWYREMTAENRVIGKGWQNKGGKRNEAWDLCYYALGGLSSQLINIGRVDWNNPPGWLAPHEKNDLVTRTGFEGLVDTLLALREQPSYDFASLGKSMG